MEDKVQIISMTQGKIKRDFIAGREVVIKKTSFEEVKKIEEARNILKKHNIYVKNRKPLELDNT